MRKVVIPLITAACAVSFLLPPPALAEDPALTNKTDNLELVIKIHQRIIENLKEKEPGDMKSYKSTIPDSNVSFEMVPIRAGEFVMGSPESEAGRNPDEGPQHKVKIEPFWMGKYEVTWNEYEMFMYPPDMAAGGESVKGDEIIDAMTAPTKPYVEMSFGMGKDGFPAISMTQHAANKYCQWLSAKTGHFYRLPTEAEWEYACRAGTTTAYSFGDDPAQLGEYAWFEDNSDWKYQKVGQKKPNPWGLHDMHGNIAEWCLDQYSADYYQEWKEVVAENPWKKSTTYYAHVARGGSWDHPAETLRSAARMFSTKDWKLQDPQLPKSIWYFTDAQFVGLRVVRPLKVPSPEEMFKYWNNGVERE